MLPADPLAMILAAVLNPATARPAGRLRPKVTGRPVGVLRRVRRPGQSCKYRPGSQRKAEALARISASR